MHPLPPVAPDPNDPDFFAYLGATFMSARVLFVASELNVFAQLADGPRTLEQLVEAIKVPRRSLRVVLDGLAAMGVLELSGDRYSNGPPAQKLLTGRDAADVRAGLRLYGKLMYPLFL